MTKPRSLAALALLAMLAPTALQAERARSALDRDLDGYVMAACLAQAGDPALKQQGDAWAGAIVERSHGGFEKFLPLADVVKAELAKTGVGVAHRDGGGDLPVPVLTCAEMRDRPAVIQALGAARRKLRRDYIGRN